MIFVNDDRSVRVFVKKDPGGDALGISYALFVKSICEGKDLKEGLRILRKAFQKMCHVLAVVLANSRVLKGFFYSFD